MVRAWWVLSHLPAPSLSDYRIGAILLRVVRRVQWIFDMNVEEILDTLKNYERELEGIIGRFSKSSHGVYIDSDDGYRLREIVAELADLITDHIPNSQHYSKNIGNSYVEGISNSLESPSYASVQEIVAAVRALTVRIERNPSLFVPKKGIDGFEDKLAGIDIIANRFHAVVMQIRQRYGSRVAMDINDEYDVQDLFHSLLKLYFDDIRREEWNPSYAGSSSRSDFLLSEVNTIVEIKKTRASLSTKQLGDQLIIDIAKYKTHPQCQRLICFVYDPEGYINNPRGIENDLSKSEEGLDVRTIIVPKHI